MHCSIIDMVTEGYRLTQHVTKIAESTAISIEKFDGTDYTSWCLEIKILLEWKQLRGSVNCTKESPDATDGTEFKSWNKQHAIARSTILLAMKRSLQEQYGVQKDAKALCDQLKEDYRIKCKAECVGCARRNACWDVEGLRECAGIHIDDPGVCEQLQPLRREFDGNDANEWAQLLPDAGFTYG